jgi:raffinose/stachyose/melibiose transport system permease protein
MSTATAAPRGAAAAAATKSARRRPGRSTNAMRGGSPMIYLVALVVAAISLGPVLYGVISGFRTNGDLILNPSGMPNPWVLKNYVGVFTNPTFWQFTVNSLAIAAITTALVVICGVMAAYPLARYHFRAREAVYMIFVAGLLFPATVGVIPLFILIRDLNLSNTWWGIALPQAAYALPFTVVILRPFLQAIPNELEEAAQLDGASRLGFFWRVLLPLSGPGLITVGVLAFVGSWNAYMLPLLLLQGENKTLPLGVADYSSEHSTDIAGVFAFTSVAMIPALIFFLAMQKRIVSGLQGAVKG